MLWGQFATPYLIRVKWKGYRLFLKLLTYSLYLNFPVVFPIEKFILPQWGSILKLASPWKFSGSNFQVGPQREQLSIVIYKGIVFHSDAHMSFCSVDTQLSFLALDWIYSIHTVGVKKPEHNMISDA